jgi:hypothetical protein
MPRPVRIGSRETGHRTFCRAFEARAVLPLGSFAETRDVCGAAGRPAGYNGRVEKKIFWGSFTILGLVADLAFPLWWALAATIPIGVFSWWLAYRSDWF